MGCTHSQLVFLLQRMQRVLVEFQLSYSDDMDPTPKFGSHVGNNDATPTPCGYEKVYDSRNEASWGEQSRSQAGLKMA